MLHTSQNTYNIVVTLDPLTYNQTNLEPAYLANSLLIYVFGFYFYTCTEEEDRDLNCVVSSLVQLMLDPHYRSLVGFQSLVQKEWVMAGHRFLDRCNHLKKNDKVEVFV